MNSADLPFLWRGSDEEAVQQQKLYFSLMKINLICLVVAAILSPIVEVSIWLAFLQAAMLLICLFSILGLSMLQPQRRWYRLRALAESTKTASWRYMMRAAPYDGAEIDADRTFALRLREIFSANRIISRVPSKKVDDDWCQITKKMKNVRNLALNERKTYYRRFRIDDQSVWYIEKSALNGRRQKLWSITLLIAVGLGVMFAFLRMLEIECFHWAVDIIAAGSSCLFAWIQANRYEELAASYALAAHEIGLLVAELQHVTDEGEFSKFVGDAENAFSREHTQWQARRDAALFEPGPH